MDFQLEFQCEQKSAQFTFFIFFNNAIYDIKSYLKLNLLLAGSINFYFFSSLTYSSFHLFLPPLLGLDCYTVGLSPVRGTPAAQQGS